MHINETNNKNDIYYNNDYDTCNWKCLLSLSMKTIIMIMTIIPLMTRILAMSMKFMNDDNVNDNDYDTCNVSE